MRLNREYEVERTVSKDAKRSHIQNLMFDVAGRRLIGTDGKMLASVPCYPDDTDQPGLVTADALKAARKLSRKGDTFLSANGTLVLPGGATFPRPTEDSLGKFPPFDAVIPEYREGDGGSISIGLDAFQLAELAKAIGSDGQVCLTFKIETEGKHAGSISPFVVQAVKGDPAAIGVLMPVTLKALTK